ncbi:MAG: preprotein translocase subunit SecA [Candidatus Nanopelagicales bacterium]|nr:preprotein translocase subunit SecA [Candidatus Nanopelagicales bacterium]
MSVLNKILRAGEGKILRSLESLANQVNLLEEHYITMSDDELRGLTYEFKARIARGESLDDLLPEAFAAVREASKRTLGQRHYDVQLMGGAALHLGNIAEMRTGEGKTLVSTLPAYLNALSGNGVHVVTVNDYLAARDAQWMGRVHRFLGLSVGTILSNMNPQERREAYGADITYGTNNEFGFDYLRDNMTLDPNDRVQREHNFAIVDEVDSILIDEARTPLLISGPADVATKWYAEFARLVPRLTAGTDYEVNEKKRTIGILEPGVEKVENWLGIENLYESVNTPLVGYLNNAIKALALFKKDKDYVVMEGEVLIVDEHTGRILAGRRYNDGMHQAIEAKEGVEIQNENQTLATITIQNYFRMYEKLAGMTGTAMTEASEFQQIYKLGVVPIPSNREVKRVDQSDLVYRTEEAKLKAVIADIENKHKLGQPVLVGTTSVAKSELVSSYLTKSGIPHEVLNAKQHDREATIIAEAGRKKAVTVATNMAGRGTDIMLGGNPEFRAAQELERRGLDPVENQVEYEAAWQLALDSAKAAVKSEHEEVVAVGGLYVLGTERHESRRIDNQLRGRSGRQGDPGETRFYLSLQDDLMRLFKGDMVNSFLQRFNVPDDVPIEAKMVTNSIRSAQTQVEAQNFEIRKNVLKYDEVMNSQRKVIYAERSRVLDGENIQTQIMTFMADTIAEYVTAATAEGFPEDWDLESLWSALKTLYPIEISVNDMIQAAGGDPENLSPEFMIETLHKDIETAYLAREKQLGTPVMRELERRVILSVLDRKWREHLYEMDYLQEGIGLRAMAQRDPLVEYQREGYDLFVAMMEGIKEESVGYLFNVEVTVTPHAHVAGEKDEVDLEAKGLAQSTENKTLQYSGPSETGEVVSTVPAKDAYANVGRNEPCPCGSGNKFKKCHGAAS